MSDDRKYLENPKEIMLALLNGKRLQNSEYCSDSDVWLYLDDSGFICEEDGAGAKSHRFPILMRNGERWWIHE
jgi:hypothetical protein